MLFCSILVYSGLLWFILVYSVLFYRGPRYRGKIPLAYPGVLFWPYREVIYINK